MVYSPMWCPWHNVGTWMALTLSHCSRFLKSLDRDSLVYPAHTIGCIVESGWGDRGLQERAMLGDKWYVTARAVNHGISNTMVYSPMWCPWHNVGTWMALTLSLSLSLSLYIYMYMTLLILDMDFLYQFNIGLIAPLFTVSFHDKFEKKNVF